MNKRNRLLKTTLGVTLIVFISKAVGFVREIIQAAYFGQGIETDAYTLAYSLFYLPILLMNSCITSTLVPLYLEAQNKYGLKRANRFASNVTNTFALFSILISVLMYALASPLVRLLAPGAEAETFGLTVQLTRIMMPSLVFVVLSIVFATILNAREQYLAAQLTGFPLSFALIIATVAFSGQYGIKAVAWGVFFAGILQVLILIPSLRTVYHHSWRLNLRDKRFKRLMLLAVPSILSMAVNELNHMIDNALAVGLAPGSVSAMRNAFTLITFVMGVLIVPLTTVMFSRMSMRVNKMGKRGVIDIVKQNLEVLALALLPIIAIAVVFSGDIITLAFMRGNFTAEDVAVTAPVFVFYIIGVLAFGYRDFLNRAFHAMQDTKTPMINAAICMLINVGLNFILRHYMGVNGLALSTSIAGIVSVGILIYRLRQSVGQMGMRKTAIELIKIAIAAVWCAFIALMLNMLLPQAVGGLQLFGRLAVATIVSLGIYIGVLILLRVRQLDFFKGLLRR